jgi:hypothetical protein
MKNETMRSDRRQSAAHTRHCHSRHTHIRVKTQTPLPAMNIAQSKSIKLSKLIDIALIFFFMHFSFKKIEVNK